MSDFTDLTLATARAGLAAKKFSAVELTQAHVTAIEQNRALNAFITETPDKALAMAKASDERLARGEGGVLEGLPIAIKDLFCTKDILTTASTASSRRTNRPSRRSCGMPAPIAWASSISTNSPWVRRT